MIFSEYLVIIMCLMCIFMCILGMFKFVSWQRVMISSVYSAACLSYLIISQHLDVISIGLSDQINDSLNIKYYVGAGAIDVIMVDIILCFSKRTRFTDFMVFACCADFLLNLSGLILYEIGP